MIFSKKAYWKNLNFLFKIQGQKLKSMVKIYNLQKKATVTSFFHLVISLALSSWDRALSQLVQQDEWLHMLKNPFTGYFTWPSRINYRIPKATLHFESRILQNVLARLLHKLHQKLINILNWELFKMPLPIKYLIFSWHSQPVGFSIQTGHAISNPRYWWLQVKSNIIHFHNLYYN